MPNLILKSSNIDTPLGTMLAIASKEALYLLAFIDEDNSNQIIKQFEIKTKSIITPGTAAPILSIKEELKSYFNNDLKVFKTPINLMGTDFQKTVWNTLIAVPFGETKSYKDQAIAIKKPSACRAVANANGANKIAIVIPCHRIIASNGTLGGYRAGIERKEWLLNHEIRLRYTST